MTAMLSAIGYDRGVRVRGVPLWVDAETRREWCILTGMPNRLPPKHQRVVASPELALALEKAGYGQSVLPLPVERWTAIAGLQTQLLSVPGALGPTAAMIVSGSDRLLVTGLLRARLSRLPETDLLVATAPALDHRGAELAQVARAVDAFAAQAAVDVASALVLVDSLEVGVALLNALDALGRAPRPVGLLAKLLPNWQVIWPRLSVGLVGAMVGDTTRVAFVESGLAGWVCQRPERVDATFRLRYWADVGALVQVVKATNARDVALVGVGPSTARCLSDRLPSHVTVRTLGAARQLELSA
jgi:hypothetical protein